ncbi:RraA family protein [Nakamurella antarctica]|uniref:Putative 4-hydroxy-4-methyl-2-oxoglutarate aldolase n=1 Tax=Nakamurella antarctica TaxID=1902245 RepID=A0A3G8ZR51_9ACTN|nr:RraA family protein [Nakamurella antarctica]AZI59295.1 RraA family protein [Nakamurella antarctica]
MKASEQEPGDERLTTAMLSDALDECGLRAQVLENRLIPVVPGTRAFGRAATAQFEAGQEDIPDDPYGAAIDYISGLNRGELAVIATGESNASAFWGELFSAAAIGAGAVGVVTDGNLRDTPQIARLGFPAFARSHRPIDFRRRMQLVASRGVVRILGVEISDGDLVMADDDGVVVVPQAVEAQVLAAARGRAAAESTVLKELLGGESLRSVWDRHRIL